MAQKSGTRIVTLEGRGALTLRDADYVATGGEGIVYRANATTVKIALDPARMTREDVPGKIRALSALKHPSIVAPQGLVSDEKGQPIGFYMPWVEGEPLSRIFVNDFRQQIGFGDAESATLAERMRETVQYAHSRKAAIVDGNELNWLVKHPGAKGPEPFIIDVDSWSIGTWPATVIMPSIRDWHSTALGESTDWFAWGIVTFQIFTGIHPYKGRLDGYKPGELERRMKDNASVFASSVRLPQSVRDFAAIPGALRDWYRATFQAGERTVPPSVFAVAQIPSAARVMRTVVAGSGVLAFERLFVRHGDPVVRTWPSGAALLGSGELVDMASNRSVGRAESVKAEVVRVENGFLIADFHDGMPVFRFVEGSDSSALEMPLAATRFFRAGERLFAVTDRELVELTLRRLGKPLLTIGSRWPIRPNAIRWFDGAAVADMLGASFLYLPLPDGGLRQVRAPELDGLTVIAGKAGPRFAMLLAVDRLGEYQRLEFALEKDYGSYCLSRGKTDTAELNAAILPNGVVATVVDDGELTIFVPSSGAVRTAKDRAVTTAMSLATWSEKVIYLKDGAVWRVRVV